MSDATTTTISKTVSPRIPWSCLRGPEVVARYYQLREPVMHGEPVMPPELPTVTLDQIGATLDVVLALMTDKQLETLTTQLAELSDDIDESRFPEDLVELRRYRDKSRDRVSQMRVELSLKRVFDRVWYRRWATYMKGFF